MAESRSLTDKFMLRLPDGMRERIKESADKNGRSMNSEIVALLEREYPPPPPHTLDYYADSLKKTLERLKVEPPNGMTTTDLVRVALTDFMLEHVSFDEIADKARLEALERQARIDAISEEGD